MSAVDDSIIAGLKELERNTAGLLEDLTRLYGQALTSSTPPEESEASKSPDGEESEAEKDLADLREQINAELHIRITNEVEGDPSVIRGVHVIREARVDWGPCHLSQVGGYEHLRLGDFLQVQGALVFDGYKFPWVATLISHVTDLDSACWNVQEDRGEDGE